MNPKVKQALKDIRLIGLNAVHKKDIVHMSKEEAEAIIKEQYTVKPFYTRKIELKPLDKNSCNLSLVIPAYNCAGYIGKCLDTLINQNTSYSYEIIVANDGSKDNTEEVIRSVKSPLIRLINQENGGAAMARNTGLMNASGEYICFFDGDDYAEPNYIDRLLSEAYKHNADIVKCGYYMYNAETPDDIGEKKLRKAAVITGDMTSRIGEYDGFLWNMISRRKLWSNIAFPEKWWFEDMISTLMTMRKSVKYVYIEEALYHYALIQTSLSRSEWKSSDVRGIDQLWLIKEIVERCKDFGLKNSSAQYYLIMRELGKMLCERTYRLDMNLRRAVFMTAAYLTDMYRKNGWDNELRQLKYRMVNKAFAKRDFALWELASLNG